MRLAVAASLVVGCAEESAQPEPRIPRRPREVLAPNAATTSPKARAPSNTHIGPSLSDQNAAYLASGAGWWCVADPPSPSLQCWRAKSECEAVRIKHEILGFWMPPCVEATSAWCFGSGYDGLRYNHLNCRGYADDCERETSAPLTPGYDRVSPCRVVP